MSTPNGTPTLTSAVNLKLGCMADGSDSHAICADRPRRQSTMFLGKEFFLDAATKRRIQWAQRAIGIITFFAVLCYIVGESFGHHGFRIGTIACSVIGLLSFVPLFYNNMSFVMMRRLLKEPNIIIIIMLTVCNLAIDIGRPADSFSLLYSFVYLICVYLFILIDVVVSKSRYLMICLGFLFVMVNLYNLYINTFGDSNNGVVLLEYHIQDNSYTIMKRSTKQSIYLQVLLFSANGICTTFVDKSMMRMVFATGHIYKSTGTASEEIEDERFSLAIKHEGTKKKLVEVI